MIFLSPCRFQSTFPRGERHLCWLVAVKHIHFNPRSLVGNDYIPVGTYTIVEISIHVPSWGTTIFTRRQPPCILFQSTFPRGERRQLRKILHKTKQISIHVPSWGTTQCLANTRRMRLFQSTFPRGERRRRWICSTEEGNFNPRSLVGNDRRLRQDIRLLGISIHVPSWGTTGDFARTSGSWAFQSTFPRGERLARLGKFGWTALFQSTFPRGERHQFAGPEEIRKIISIHVPSWGTTANFHKYSLFFYAINIIFLLFIIPSLFSLVLFMLLF